MRQISRILLFVAGPMMLVSCNTLSGKPDHVIGTWGGPHAGLDLQGGLADVQFDCASGTIDDPLYPGPDGAFSVKGTYRTGAPGPIKVGQFFRSLGAVYSGRVTAGAAKRGPQMMTLHVTLDDGTNLGPFELTEGAQPQLTRCL